MIKLKDIGSELERLGEDISQELRSLGISSLDMESDDFIFNGKQMSLSDLDCGGCHDSGRRDIVDLALAKVASDLINRGHTPDQATDAVYTAMADLMDVDAIQDSPQIDDPEGVKVIWVNNAIPKIKELLIERGYSL
jgi:hypothetical protein